MATLEQIDSSLPLDLYPYQHDLDGAVIRPVAELKPVILDGMDVALFLNWAKGEGWRAKFEEVLQSVANDSLGRKLLTTWMPLVTFRESFCSGGRHMQNAETSALMERVRVETKGWRTAGVDTVDVSGRALI
jgi:hypothetical protein